MKRVFIIHKWGGTPDSDWYQWLKRELGQKGVQVFVPSMPDTGWPKIGQWVPYLFEMVGRVDEETYLVGHSMGCQAILRYLEGLGNGEEAGGALLVAGFVTVKKLSVNDEEYEIMRPWLETPIDMKAARKHAKAIVSIFSDNDPFVPLGDSDVFRNELGSEIVVMPKAGHFTSRDGYKELHVALNELMKML